MRPLAATAVIGGFVGVLVALLVGVVLELRDPAGPCPTHLARCYR